MISIPFRKLDPRAQMPRKNFPSDAGWDLFALEDQMNETTQMPVRTGIAVSIPLGYYGQIQGRSGMAIRHATGTLAGVIDCGFTGEIIVILACHASYGYAVKAGDKVAQMVIHRVPEVEFVEVASLEDTARGEKGFGSSDASPLPSPTM